MTEAAKLRRLLSFCASGSEFLWNMAGCAFLIRSLGIERINAEILDKDFRNQLSGYEKKMDLQICL